MKIENRMLRLILLCMLFIHTSTYAAKDPATSKTLAILQLDFANKPESMQRTLLRSMALMDTDEALPFFVGVSIDEKYTEEIRREALKAILAIDSKKYRSVLEPLQTSPLEEDKVIRTIQLFDGDFLMPFMTSLSFKEDQKIIDLKLSAILKYWKKDQIDQFDFKTWPSNLASENLVRLIGTTKRNSQRNNLIELWSYVHTDKSIKDISRLLYTSDDATLRKRVIYALRKVNNERSRAALKGYQAKATAEEKKWIKDILAVQGDGLAK